MIVASFAEVISIGAVLPFLGVLTAPELIFNHPIAQPLVHALNLAEPKQLLLPLTIAFTIAVLFLGAMRFIMLWTQTRFSYAIGADLSISICRRTLYQPYIVHLLRNSSEIIAGISGKASGVVGNIIMPSMTILSSVPMLFTILIALIVIEPMIAFAAFGGFGAIYALFIVSAKKHLIRHSQRTSREQNNVSKPYRKASAAFVMC